MPPTNDAIFFRRGIPAHVWLNSQAAFRWATDAEVREIYGMSRDEWLKHWREDKLLPKPRRAA